MNKKKIQSNYREKIKKINELNKLYFNESKSAVSDAEYDRLKKEIIFLENK